MAKEREQLGNPPENLPEDEGLRRRRWDRRTFIRTGLAVGAGVVASAYVKPNLQSIGIPRAFAQATPGPGACTPGLWKNKTGSWTTFDKDDVFDNVFGVSAFGTTKTLLEVLGTGGGGLNALGRHATAALLNAAAAVAGLLVFPLSVATVISDTQAAIASSDPAEPEATKDAFEALNETEDLCAAGGRADGP